MEIDVTNLKIGDKIYHRDKGEIIVRGIMPHCGDYLIVNDGPWVYLKYCTLWKKNEK